MGPYGNQTAGRAVGPYASRKKPGILPANQNDRTNRRGAAPAARNVKATQAFLRAHGYNIAVDGVWGPQTAAAVKDWHRAPKDRKGGEGFLGGLKQTAIKAGESVLAKTSTSKTLKTKVSAAKSVAAKTGKSGGGSSGGGGSALPNLGGGNVGTMLSPSYADAVAGEQYDPTIHDLGIQRARQPAQEAQDLSDIKNFYAQVMGHQKTAAARDHAISAAGQDSVQQATQAILGSIGGAANAGSSTVGAAGAADLGTLQALAQNNDQYNQDVAPLLAAEGAAAGTREIHAQDQAAQDIATKIQDALGARGQAKAKALGDVTQANNALAQTRFSNRIALGNLAAGAQLSGLKAADLVSNINYRNARAKSIGKTKTGSLSWLSMAPGDRNKAISTSLAPFLGANGELLPGADPNAVANQVRASLRSQGFSSARRAGYKGPGVNPLAQQQILTGLHSALTAAIARRAIPTA